MEMHNCGKFHQYSICGCQVKSFQIFAYRFPSINWPFLFFFSFFLWGKGVGGTLILWSDFAEIFPRYSTQTEKNSVWIIFGKIVFLLKQGEFKVCTFDPTLTPCFLLKMAEIKKKKEFSKKTFSHRAIQIW